MNISTDCELLQACDQCLSGLKVHLLWLCIMFRCVADHEAAHPGVQAAAAQPDAYGKLKRLVSRTPRLTSSHTCPHALLCQQHM